MTDLPHLIDDWGVTIDGYTQPGSSPNTATHGTNATLLIELRSVPNPTAGSGLIISSSANVVRGLVINGFRFYGVWIRGGSGNTVLGNFIGTEADGLRARPNEVAGIASSEPGAFSLAVKKARSAGSPNLIGDGTAAGRNLISGNGAFGIEVQIGAPDTWVLGNLVGTDRSGDHPLANVGGMAFVGASGARIRDNVVSGNEGDGISVGGSSNTVISGNRVGVSAAGTRAVPNGYRGVILYGSSDNVIGGSQSGEGNIIGGNGLHGIWLDHPVSMGNRIEGNAIGTDATGTVPMGNGWAGIAIEFGASANFVGGVAAAGNRILFNGMAGVVIGNNASDLAFGNRVLSNSIARNGGLAIDIGNDGLTPNDPLDGDNGPNRFQNSPSLFSVSASAGATRVSGRLNSEPDRSYRLEFFSNDACDPSGAGEGEVLLGSTNTVTNENGLATFVAALPAATPPGRWVTATATDADGNTSEFSRCLSGALRFYTVAPCRVVDTRLADGPHGGPPLAAGVGRAFVLSGRCGIPATAQTVSLNATITSADAAGHLVLFPAGSSPPTSTLNYRVGQTRPNNAIVGLGPNGDVVALCVQASGSAQLILDVNGYFE